MKKIDWILKKCVFVINLKTYNTKNNCEEVTKFPLSKKLMNLFVCKLCLEEIAENKLIIHSEVCYQTKCLAQKTQDVIEKILLFSSQIYERMKSCFG